MRLEPPKGCGNNPSDVSISVPKKNKKLFIYLNTLGKFQYILDYNKFILSNTAKEKIYKCAF